MCLVPTTQERLWSGLAMLQPPGLFQHCRSLCSVCVSLDQEPTTITGAQDVRESSLDTVHECSAVKLPKLSHAIPVWQLLSSTLFLQVLQGEIQRLSQVEKGFDSFHLLRQNALGCHFVKTGAGICPVIVVF